MTVVYVKNKQGQFIQVRGVKSRTMFQVNAKGKIVTVKARRLKKRQVPQLSEDNRKYWVKTVTRTMKKNKQPMSRQQIAIHQGVRSGGYGIFYSMKWMTETGLITEHRKIGKQTMWMLT
jgi:mRNA-degrading endonuclease RelE of RelBE toxin-antitoxin system